MKALLIGLSLAALMLAGIVGFFVLSGRDPAGSLAESAAERSEEANGRSASAPEASPISELSGLADAVLKDCSDGRCVQVYETSSAALKNSTSLADFEAFMRRTQQDLGLCSSSHDINETFGGGVGTLRATFRCTKGSTTGLFRFSGRRGAWQLVSIKIPAPEP